MAKDEEQGCSRFCRNQWKLSSFGFNYDQPRDFITFQWGYPKIFMVWTVLWCLLHVIVLALQPYFFRDELPNWIWFTYLTNWSYAMLGLYSVIESVAAVYVNIRRKDIIHGEAQSMPWYFKLLWIQYYLATVPAITVTLLYYLLLNEGNDANSVLKHFINFLYILLNLLMGRKPYHILHFYIPMIFSFVYILFTLVYQAGFNQSPVYSALDWDNIPNVFLYALGIPLIFVPLLMVILYALTVMRDAIGIQCAKLCTDTKENSQPC